MTEKEKMLAGALYRASDPALVEERRRAKALCRRYNDSDIVLIKDTKAQ